jgi:hypothetical protein
MGQRKGGTSPRSLDPCQPFLSLGAGREAATDGSSDFEGSEIENSHAASIGPSVGDRSIRRLRVRTEMWLRGQRWALART